MESPPPSRSSCDLREGIDRAIRECRENHSSRGLQFKTILDPRLPRNIACEGSQLAEGLRGLLEGAVASQERAFFTLIVYEMDDTTRSALCFEIEGTKGSFILMQEPTRAVVAVEARKLSILLAEDNAVNQQVAVECLRCLQYECAVVGNGRAAVEAAAQVSYDVIFMDVHMPVMDGLQATREIRLLPNGHLPYIAALTAYALPGDKARCLEAGMDDYVAKPCRVENLASVLRKVRTLGGGAPV